MKYALCALVLFVGCGGDALEAPCSKGMDCVSGEWCVRAWGTLGVDSTPAGVCAQQCTTNADCGGGTCETMDGVTQDAMPLPRACK